MSSLCLSEICCKHGSLRFQKCFCEVFNETVSLCFKEAYLTWKSERLEFLLDLLTYQNSVLPDLKKIASCVRVSFCVHDYHGAQIALNGFEWRLVEGIFFFLLVKKELSALPL